MFVNIWQVAAQPRWWWQPTQVGTMEEMDSTHLREAGLSEIIANFGQKFSLPGHIRNLFTFSAWTRTLWIMSWLLDSSGTWKTQIRLTWPGTCQTHQFHFPKKKLPFPTACNQFRAGGCPILTWDPSLGCLPLHVPWSQFDSLSFHPWIICKEYFNSFSWFCWVLSYVLVNSKGNLKLICYFL